MRFDIVDCFYAAMFVLALTFGVLAIALTIGAMSECEANGGKYFQGLCLKKDYLIQ